MPKVIRRKRRKMCKMETYRFKGGVTLPKGKGEDYLLEQLSKLPPDVHIDIWDMDLESVESIPETDVYGTYDHFVNYYLREMAKTTYGTSSLQNAMEWYTEQEENMHEIAERLNEHFATEENFQSIIRVFLRHSNRRVK